MGRRRGGCAFPTCHAHQERGIQVSFHSFATNCRNSHLLPPCHLAAEGGSSGSLSLSLPLPLGLGGAHVVQCGRKLITLGRWKLRTTAPPMHPGLLAQARTYRLPLLGPAPSDLPFLASLLGQAGIVSLLNVFSTVSKGQVIRPWGLYKPLWTTCCIRE